MSDETSYPKSKAIYGNARTVLPGGNTRTTVFQQPFPLYAAYGKGCYIWDVDDNKRIDCINNYTALIHGHLHPHIIAAVQRQLTFGTCFGMPTASEVALASELNRRVPSLEAVRFTNSGTEAVMMAIKAARAFTGRAKIAKIEGAYHGTYDAAEISLDPTPAQWGEDIPNAVPYAKGTPASVLEDVLVLPFNDAHTAEEILAPHAQELAAILIDPLPNRAGLIPASPEFLQTLRRIADATGAVLIFDEVISFRVAYAGAQSRFGVQPDLTTLGKVIGGGFPVGAVGGKKEVMSVFDPSSGKPALPHGGTFTANPVTMVAGLAALELLDEPCFTRLEEIGAAVKEGANDAFRRHGVAGCAVGMGSLLRLHFTERNPADYRTTYPSDAERAKLRAFNQALLVNGVLSSSYGLMALSTPMGDEQISQVIDAIDKSIASLKA